MVDSPPPPKKMRRVQNYVIKGSLPREQARQTEEG